MSVFTVLCNILVLPFILVRLLRWLAWSQQKEYRVDRIWSFLLSSEGMQELTRLVPKKQDFTRSGLKRPALTMRSLTVAFLSLMLLGYTFSLSLALHWWWLPFLVYFLIPLFPMLSGIGTEWFKSLLSLILLFLAHQKLAKTQPKIIGITGSYGKTATRHLAVHLLSKHFQIYTPPKSHNTPLSIAWDIVKHYQKQEIVFLEFAAYKKGEIRKLARWFQPDISLITGLAPQHLALFGSLQKIIEAKGELVKATKLNGLVLYNAMDPGTEKICLQDPSKKKRGYSPLQKETFIEKAELTEKGKLNFSWRKHSITTHLVGLHHQETVAGAIALALFLEIPEEIIVHGLQSFVPEEVFTQTYFHPTTQSLIIHDGRTTNPKGFRAALSLLSYFKKQGKNTLLITGGIVDLGEESDSIHLDLARAAKPCADFLFYTGSDGKEIFKEVFRNQMTDSLPTFLSFFPKCNADDVILIEGRIPLALQKILQRKKND